MTKHADAYDWNEDAVARLRLMHSEGYTGGQIALAFGVSRNTIIGKTHRLHLGQRGMPTDPVRMAPTVSQQPTKSRAKPRSEWKRKAPRTSLPTLATPINPRPLPPPEPSTATAVTTLAIAPGQCKWPLNDGKPEWLHCGAPADGSYCEHHVIRSRSIGTHSERAAVARARDPGITGRSPRRERRPAR